MVTAAVIQLILIYLPLVVMGICVIYTIVPERHKKKLREFTKIVLKKGDDSNDEEFIHFREIDESDNHTSIYHRIENSLNDTLSL